MDLAKLTHRAPRPGLPLLDRFELTGARAHEMCGSARRRLALWLARGSGTGGSGTGGSGTGGSGTGGSGTGGGAHDWPVLWIRPDWHPDGLNMQGVRSEIDPGRLIHVECCRPADLLWSMEEALRSGLLRLVVADLPELPGLTPVRRLHLAAEAGAERTGRAPIGLLLTPGDGGAAGVESRWRLSPNHPDPDTARWRLSRLRARDAAPADWTVSRDRKGMATLAPDTTPGYMAPKDAAKNPHLHPT